MLVPMVSLLANLLALLVSGLGRHLLPCFVLLLLGLVSSFLLIFCLLIATLSLSLVLAFALDNVLRCPLRALSAVDMATIFLSPGDLAPQVPYSLGSRTCGRQRL